MKKIVIVILTLSFLIVTQHVFAGKDFFTGQDGITYSQGVRAAKRGQRDFAFMSFRALLLHHPDSKYREKSLFAKAEYYFLLPDYSAAAKDFRLFVESYPDSKAKLFALGYLLKIARIKENEEKAKLLEKKIIELEQMAFVFKDYKKVKYKSALNRRWEAFYYIDRVEFFVGGEIFAKITF